MKYKGIDKEKILEVKKVKLVDTDAYTKFTEEEFEEICKGADSFEQLYKEIENQLKARKNDTEMAIICEMAMMYLDSLKGKEADKEAYNKGREDALQEVQNCESYGYEKGLNDAWKLANKISDIYSASERARIFNYVVDGITVMDILRDFTPQEALAKLEAYEKEQAQIKVGDVVFNKDTNEHCVITHIEGKVVVYCLYDDGSCGTSNIKECEKTGKHIDIQKILDELKAGTE